MLVEAFVKYSTIGCFVFTAKMHIARQVLCYLAIGLLAISSIQTISPKTLNSYLLLLPCHSSYGLLLKCREFRSKIRELWTQAVEVMRNFKNDFGIFMTLVGVFEQIKTKQNSIF